MSQLETKENIKFKVPKKYLVFILNDNYSSFDFVIETLMSIFDKSYEEAFKITNEVHNSQRGLCGIYSKQIAEMKTIEANKFAKANSQPLKTIFIEEGK